MRCICDLSAMRAAALLRKRVSAGDMNRVEDAVLSVVQGETDDCEAVEAICAFISRLERSIVSNNSVMSKSIGKSKRDVLRADDPSALLCRPATALVSRISAGLVSILFEL